MHFDLIRCTIFSRCTSTQFLYMLSIFIFQNVFCFSFLFVSFFFYTPLKENFSVVSSPHKNNGVFRLKNRWKFIKIMGNLSSFVHFHSINRLLFWNFLFCEVLSNSMCLENSIVGSLVIFKRKKFLFIFIKFINNIIYLKNIICWNKWQNLLN